METLKLLANFVLVIIFSFQLFAQDQTALPFLQLSPSPQQNGLGWTGVSNPNNDPFGFYFNPAMLGYSSQHTNLSLQFYPSKVDWLGYRDINFNSTAINFGYNFRDVLNGLNLSAGLGYIRNSIDINNLITSGSKDSYNAYGIGISLDYYILLSLGITNKIIHSEWKDLINNNQFVNYTSNSTAIDYGFLLSIPVIKLIDDNLSLQVSDDSNLKPFLSYSLGYSRLNIGDEIYYVDPAQNDPIPLTARLGHTIGIGVNFVSYDINIKLINYDLILEAEDVLVIRDSLGRSTYQGMLGDIDIWKNLFQLKGDENVVVHKGHSINFVETITILKGSFIGRGFRETRFSDGFVISTNGLFKWLNSFDLGSDFLEFFTKHFEFRYTSSTNLKDYLNTDFSSISLFLSNINF